MKKIKILLFALILIAQISLVFGLVYFNLILQNTGIVNVKTVGVEVYSDPNCTKPLSQIDWGMFDPGETKTTTTYIKSISNINSTLSFNTTDWTPSIAKQYLILTWDYKNTTLIPNQIIKVIFSLKVSSSVEGVTNFSFNIIITATETEVKVTILTSHNNTYTLTPLYDSWIAGTYVTDKAKNFGSNPFMAVGRDSVGPYRGLITFNLTTLSSQSITSAKLKLYYYSFFTNYNNPSNRLVGLYKNLQSWDEQTATWNIAPTFNSTPSATLSIPSSYSWVEFDITADIKYWLSKGGNYGWTIKFINEGSPDSLAYFYSKESTTLPVLEVITNET